METQGHSRFPARPLLLIVLLALVASNSVTSAAKCYYPKTQSTVATPTNNATQALSAETSTTAPRTEAPVTATAAPKTEAPTTASHISCEMLLHQDAESHGNSDD